MHTGCLKSLLQPPLHPLAPHSVLRLQCLPRTPHTRSPCTQIKEGCAWLACRLAGVSNQAFCNPLLTASFLPELLLIIAALLQGIVWSDADPHYIYGSM